MYNIFLFLEVHNELVNSQREKTVHGNPIFIMDAAATIKYLENTTFKATVPIRFAHEFDTDPFIELKMSRSRLMVTCEIYVEIVVRSTRQRSAVAC